MAKDRYLSSFIHKDLNDKMVFIAGPRQVGKTTLARDIMKKYFSKISYFLWDNRDDRKNIIAYRFPADYELIVFDEIHKYKNWKNHIKGIYDKLKDKYKFIVTGSSRLDIFRKSGDSLQGRYHYYRLHPFSMREIAETNQCYNAEVLKELKFFKYNRDYFDILFKFGGFPEPMIKQSEVFLRRWHNEKLERLFREDIRDVEKINDINSMKLLSDILPEKASGILSLNSLRENLSVSHKAVKRWVEILESFYYIFRVYPYLTDKYKSIKKEPKLYLWDWSEVEDESKRFENMVASHLLKYVNFLYDNLGYKAELNFLRDIEKREVDFLVSIDKKTWFSVEVKLNETDMSKNLIYYKEKLKIPFNYQVIKKSGVDIYQNDIRIISADKFFTGLC
ncbi:MAG: AAA family ATPase [Elusimicrobiota bacterium]